jgi:hypothetical protein
MAEARTDGTDDAPRAQRPVALYPDTADLSYLVLGRIPGLTAVEVTTVRDDLLALVRAGQLWLRLSLFHAAEIVLRAKVASAASVALRALPTSRP